ncbi:uncharacterized protein LOC128851520 [Cuculus canorus]|uniref:uncharacterized protein LOC128851520 n=1 Tax=Cuculus canorus TaxID=55661 RepID=UPI0023AB1859|nr:uncharacterized protein LOC128851520 [Cuculus canorus]
MPTPQAPHTPGPESRVPAIRVTSEGAPGESPHSPAQLPLICAGLQTALHGCLFDPRVFSIQWMNASLPSPATSMLGYSSLPTAVLWGPRGCETRLVCAAPGTPHQGQPQHLQGRVSTPATPVLPTGFANHQDTEKQLAQLRVSKTPMPMGLHPGSDAHSHCAAPHVQAFRDPSSNFLSFEETLLDCQDSASSNPMPEESGSPSRALSHPDISSLSLPMELLTPDYSTPETTSAVLSLDHLSIIGMGPEEQWWEVGTDLPDF